MKKNNLTYIILLLFFVSGCYFPQPKFIPNSLPNGKVGENYFQILESERKGVDYVFGTEILSKESGLNIIYDKSEKGKLIIQGSPAKTGIIKLRTCVIVLGYGDVIL